MKKQKNFIKIVLLGAVLCCLLAGCGQKSKNVNINEGMAAVEALDYNKALQCFEKAMVDGEDLRLLYRGQGLAYMGLTQYTEAAAAFEKALSNSNGQVDAVDYDINYYLATVYYKLGEINKSIQAYDSIIALLPKDKVAYYLRGCLRIGTDFEKAKADFDKAISLDKDDYTQLIDIYLVLEQNGYKEVGQEYLQAALDSGSKSMTDYECGRMYYYLKDYDNARNYLEKARKTAGYEAVLLLGKTYEELGDNNYAVSVYNSFIADDQTNAKVYNQLGLCKMEMGAYEEALAAFQAGMNIENNDMMQTLKFNEIVTYEYLGEYKKAAVLLDSYLTTYPDDETAKREYTFLKTR
ncbi:MAG: tetratricopeptide repeat protein [Clostridiales bacterium]|nr:tetratricopeptide repeat protein [Clostridiales bacterium]